MEVAATEEGKLLGVRVKLQADMGAYASLVGPGIPILGAFHYHGVYDCEAYSFTCTSVFTNQTPTDAYRAPAGPRRPMRPSGSWTRSPAGSARTRPRSGR
jgi:carbon-monoxide dehydrogenase large subunit